MNKIWSKMRLRAMGYFNGASPLISTIQQTSLLKLSFDFFEKNLFFSDVLGQLKSFKSCGGRGKS